MRLFEKHSLNFKNKQFLKRIIKLLQIWLLDQQKNKRNEANLKIQFWSFELFSIDIKFLQSHFHIYHNPNSLILNIGKGCLTNYWISSILLRGKSNFLLWNSQHSQYIDCRSLRYLEGNSLEGKLCIQILKIAPQFSNFKTQLSNWLLPKLNFHSLLKIRTLNLV